jgi:recombination protein RecA
MAVDLDFMKKSGSWYSYEGKQIGQGRHKAIEYIANDLAIVDSLKSKITESA